MLRWIGNALASSVGKKLVLGATGLLLVGFLLEHLHGNLKLTPYLGEPAGEAFDDYVAFLLGFGFYTKLAEVGLFALFACHVYLALRVTLENREARRQRYVVRNDRGAKTLGSASMFVTGALILAYLIKHLLDFRFAAEFHDAPYDTVAAKLSQPLHGLVYLAISLVVGLHVSHGFQSAFQSLGLNHPRWTPIVRAAGYGIAALFALGFASIPFYFLFFWSEGAAH
jgi:succinate dehydrogenase / fumarate reductase cytochrome b subunit